MVFLYGIIIMLILYTWTGSLYPEGTGYRLDFLGENFIPFVPEMAIFYIFLFFPMLILTLIYFGFLDEEKGYGLGWSIVIMNAIATIIYIIFPVSTYWWRQELLANKIEGNFFADLMYFYYTHETSFNCLPSMHAGMSTICFFTWYQYYKINPTFKRKIIAIIALIIAVGVVLSTLFVKQHYIIDEIAGVALAFAVGMFVFRRSSGWNPSEITNQT
ncbi:MAG: phosphatase PAP2 family protein [Promethearchaeota archaeon]|nr:MAG: phosphatase PAP2 family protein [Candidatus Lokiarchaeota archaeon]